MKKRKSLIEQRDAWKARAISAEQALDAMAVEIAESWRAQRAVMDHRQRVARERESGR